MIVVMVIANLYSAPGTVIGVLPVSIYLILTDIMRGWHYYSPICRGKLSTERIPT